MSRGEVARNVTRGAFFLGLERALASLSTILYSALIARWLGPGQYGMFTLAFSMVALATGLAGNTDMYLERFAAEYQVKDQLRTLRRAFGIALGAKLALGVLAAVVLLVLTPRLVIWYHMPELGILLPLLTAFIVSDGFSTTGRAMLFGLQRYEWVSGLSLIFNLGRSALAVLLWDTHHSVRGLAIGLSVLAVTQAVAIWVASVVVLRRAQQARPADAGPEPGVVPGLPRQMFAYCAPLFGASLSFLSGQNIGKLVLGIVLTPADLGFFAFAFGTVERIVEVVYTLPRALLPSLTQMVARDDRESLHYVFGQAFRLVQVVACVVSLLIFVFARELVFAVGGPMFQRAIPMLRLLALVPMVRTAQQPLTMLFQAWRRPGYVLSLALVKLLSEVTGWVALVILVRMGAPGACWANVLGAITAFAGAMWLGAGLLPEGSGERLGATLRCMALVVPLELLAIAADRWLVPEAALVARAALPLVAIIGLFPLGLIVAYDLEKVSSLPLPGSWLARVRAGLVSATGAMIRTFGPGRPA